MSWEHIGASATDSMRCRLFTGGGVKMYIWIYITVYIC